MKTIRWWRAFWLLWLCAAGAPVSAQPANANSILFDEIKARAENGDATLQYQLGLYYFNGNGVAKDYLEAARWWRKAAGQGNAKAEYEFGLCYYAGYGVEQNYAEAAQWWTKASEQGDALAQYNLGCCCFYGYGVAKNLIAADKWLNLASAQGNENARQLLRRVENSMLPDQIAQAQQAVRDFKPSQPADSTMSAAPGDAANSSLAASGTGFFVSDDGYLVTNEHVVKNAARILLVTGTGRIPARVVKVDVQHDLALLKADGHFTPLPVVSSDTVQLGETVATIGYPDFRLQGQSPKLAKGEIAALSGVRDDPGYFQISVPVQPGNSGGALVDERGNVVGIVSAQLDADTAFLTTGVLPEDVNYAVKSSFLLPLLESVPGVPAKLKKPATGPRNFEDVVKAAEQSTVLVLAIH